MKLRLAIATLLFMMVQAVLFGTGVVLILTTPLREHAPALMPLNIVLTTLVGALLSWWLAPRLRAQYWRKARPWSSLDRALAALS